MNKIYIKKIISTSLIITFTFTPLVSFAVLDSGANTQFENTANTSPDPQGRYSDIYTGPTTFDGRTNTDSALYNYPSNYPVNNTGSPVNQNGLVPINLNTQAAGATFGANSQAGNFSASGATGSFASCAGLGSIANSIKSSIGKALGSLMSEEVRVNDSQLRSKDTGISIGPLKLPSWDQAGWCLVNSIIESIGAATVNWINSGFQGNPVFVDDPTQFFTDLADLEAGMFINELSGGFLCSPIQDIVRLNLINNYNNSISPFANQAQCTFSGGAENLESFMSGESFSWDDWMSYTQSPQNNPFGATIMSQIELDSRIASSLGLQSNILDWGNGYLSIKDPETKKITTPGTLIDKQINDRIGSGQRRLEIADEFDEVVSALVEQLIKIAISEMTQATQ